MAILTLISCNSAKNEKDKQVHKKEQVQGLEKPNVIIIYPDQLRRYSAGFWSEPEYRDEVIGEPDPVVTPTIDKLAKNGMVFTRAVANYPLCSPSRGMMLSGMYPEQNGIWNNCRIGREDDLKENIATITDLFYEGGYEIGYFGKSHYIKPVPHFNEAGDYVGTDDPPGGHYVNPYDTYVPPGPDRHNIGYFYQVLKDQHYDPLVYSNDPTVVGGNEDGELYLPKKFSTKIESETIIKYLRNEDGQRQKNKPFFIIWSINPPHSPWDEANTDMVELRKHYDIDKFPKIDSTLVVRSNADLKVASYARNYFANTTSIDKYIGEVVVQLEDMNILDNTIIVFSADHGEMLGSHGLTDKNVLYTEAIAVPFIVHWPKKVEQGTTDVLFNSPDILPTIMGLAGMEDKIPQTVEGKDLSAFIHNPDEEAERPESILLMLGNSRGILTDRYTLVLQENKKPWDEKVGTNIEEAYIFENVEDPYQLHKIPLDEKPKVAANLLKELAMKLKKANDPWYQKQKYNNIIPYPEAN